jgi:hypothetical protein
MKMPFALARRPSAGAWAWPVRDLLGGEISPAAFVCDEIHKEHH